jgi:uncharacterized membrane protein
MTLTLILFAIFFPAGVIFLRERGGIFKRLNPLVTCYLAGIIIGNTGLVLPEMISSLDLLSTITVALSIPLMLFSIDIRSWKAAGNKALLSMALAAASITIVSFISQLIFHRMIPDTWKLSGLLIGVYTGGTPNLAAIRTALDVDMTLYLGVHTSDMILSAIYILFVITVAKRIFSKVLPKFPGEAHSREPQSITQLESYGLIFSKPVFLPLLAAFGLAVLIFGVGAGFSYIVPPEVSTMVVILIITTLSIGASLMPGVRNIRMTFQAGEYIILIFCLAVGAMGNFQTLLHSAPQIFLFVALALFGSMFLHLFLCRIFKIDVDTMLITSTSAMCSPPFVGVVAVSIKNRSLILPGITTGIIGYAVGNYLGILMAQLFHLISP